jgi:hypothetical protein
MTAGVDALADLDHLGLELRPRRLEDAQGRLHDLRTDTVAVGHGDGGLGARCGGFA